MTNIPVCQGLFWVQHKSPVLQASRAWPPSNGVVSYPDTTGYVVVSEVAINGNMR